jgi:Mg2+-importing ATPase
MTRPSAHRDTVTARLQGLSSEQARQLLAECGPNELTPPNRLGVWRQLLQLFANPLVVILLIAAGLSGLAGESASAAIITVVVLLGAGLNFFQTYRSERAVERLRDSVSPTATVERDGRWSEIRRRDVVPGDLVRLAAGDLVPADGTLLEARDLHLHEAALTGESMPVEKSVATNHRDSARDEDSLVFMGTSVISGTAIARITATGSKTRFGDIATRLSSRPPETEFDRGTRRFGFLIMEAVVFLLLLVFLANLVARRDPLESLLFSVALAVGLTPEFLPMIIAVTLSQGAVHLARQKVVVKHLAAMQNFGSIDILCSDKTGTLTSGSIRLESCVDPFGHPADRVLQLAYLNSLHETGIKSPLDAAILQHGAPAVDGYEKLDEIPFDFERRRLSIVVGKGDERIMIVKGAPEGVLELCTRFEIAGNSREFDAATRLQCEATEAQLASQGFRVLAVAYRLLPPQAAYAVADEKELVLVGFVTFFDPPLEDAARILADLARDGVQVKILTGDSGLVAGHLCGQVGIDVGQIVLGTDLDRVSDTALGHVAERATVFARVSPAQKNRIILALKHRGHVVGFLGDGVNDAPSLHAADVGISVSTAVDVAKDAAEIILLDQGLNVLHAGIIEGRKAFGNVMKYLLMGTSSNFGNMISMAAASFFLPFLPMLPMQILLNNFLYDLSQVTIPTDNIDPAFIRKPRRWDIRLIRNFMLTVGPVSSIYDFLTFFVLLRYFHSTEAEFHTGWFVESLATQTLVIFVVGTAGNPFLSRPSLPLAATVVAVVVLGLVLPVTPWAATLGFTPLPAGFLAFLVAATVTYLAAVQLVKRRVLGAALD